jgi:hypothetical protein
MSEGAEVLSMENRTAPTITYNKLLAQATQFGLIVPGRTVRGYMEWAIENNRFECVYIWGFQGSMKSNETLQQGFWIYKDWDQVIKHLVFRPGKSEYGAQKLLDSLGIGNRIPWMGWDDMGVHYPSTTYKTNIQQYEAVDALFAAIRTKCSVITINSHVIDRTPKNIKDNISIEMFIGRNQMVMSERICRLPSYDRIESYFFKVPIEEPHIFDYTLVPKDVWDEYWQLRLQLAEEALQKLGEAYGDEMPDLSNYVSLYDIVEQGIAAPSQVVSYAARDMISVVKIGGVRYVPKDDVEHVLKHLGKKKHQKVSQ